MTDNPIINRMMDVTGAANFSRLCGMIGITPQTMQPYKGLQTVPESWLTRLQEKYRINPAYLKTGQGPQRLGEDNPAYRVECVGRKYETMLFHPNGQDHVFTDHPAAGLVTNASGETLPIGHMIEHILCLEVRPALSVKGEVELTGTGLAMPTDWLQRLGISPTGARSLQTTDGLVIFDEANTILELGAAYVIAHNGLLAIMRLTMESGGVTGFCPLAGSTEMVIPLSVGPKGPSPRVLGRASWIGRPL